MALSCSGRAVCRRLSLSRGTLNYRPKPLPARKQKLELEIVRVSQAHPTLGYKKIARKLVELGYCVNKKLMVESGPIFMAEIKSSAWSQSAVCL